MENETVYFLASGQAEAVIRDYVVRYKDAHNTVAALIRELGAMRYYWDGTFDFAPGAVIPPGLARYATFSKTRGNYCTTKTAEGKAIRARTQALSRPPGRRDLTTQLRGTANVPFAELGYMYGIHEVGSKLVISAGRGVLPPTMPTCEPIRASEYWHMVEQAKQVNSAAASPEEQP